jgi:predicted transcriptional regulator
MANVATSIRIDDDLLAVYDQLAAATDRPRNQLFIEALRRYAATEGWQITEVRRTLAGLEDGTVSLVPGDRVIAELIARGRLTQEALDAGRAEHDVMGRAAT